MACLPDANGWPRNREWLAINHERSVVCRGRTHSVAKNAPSSFAGNRRARAVGGHLAISRTCIDVACTVDNIGWVLRVSASAREIAMAHWVSWVNRFIMRDCCGEFVLSCSSLPNKVGEPRSCQGSIL